jgi:hypothetical protein
MICPPHRRGMVLAMTLAFVVLAVRTVIGLRAAIGVLPAGTLMLMLALAGGLYLASHALRALRLAVIAVPLLDLTLRKAMMLHLFVAPWSLIMPLKIDELVRANELAMAGGSWARAVMTLLIDRVMDAVLLLGMIALLGFAGNALLAVMLGTALLVIAGTFLALPIVLELVQRHVFVHHYHAQAPRVLRLTDSLRRLLLRGRATIAATAPLLVLASMMITALELAAAAVVLDLTGAVPTAQGAIALILRRTNESWRMIVFNQPVNATVALLTLAFVLPLLVGWLVISLPYLDNRTPSRRGAGLPAGAVRPC